MGTENKITKKLSKMIMFSGLKCHLLTDICLDLKFQIIFICVSKWACFERTHDISVCVFVGKMFIGWMSYTAVNVLLVRKCTFNKLNAQCCNIKKTQHSIGSSQCTPQICCFLCFHARIFDGQIPIRHFCGLENEPFDMKTSSTCNIFKVYGHLILLFEKQFVLKMGK